MRRWFLLPDLKHFIESALYPTYEKAWDIRRVSAGTELTNKSFNEATRLDRKSYIHVLT